MKILAPIDRFEEAERLIQAGADELYGGFVPSEWKNKYTMAGSMNKRTFQEAQFTSREEVEKTVDMAHDAGKAFYLTLNNDYYSPPQYKSVLNEAAWAATIGVDAILVADIGLILAIKEKGIPVELHLSILAAVMNSRAAGFYKDLGVARIVLDRTLTLGEIERILKQVKGVDFEVFIMYGKCPNIEGLCTFFHHDDPKHVWPCCRNYVISTSSYDERAKEVLAAADAQNAWSQHERGKACGLCAMYDLSNAGIRSLKIAGRGRRTDDKIIAVKMVDEMRGLIEAGISKDDFYKQAAASYKRTYGQVCDPYVCYSPDLRDESH